jgi:chorismate synthase
LRVTTFQREIDVVEMHDALTTVAERGERHDPDIAHRAITVCQQLKILVIYDVLLEIDLIVSKSMQSLMCASVLSYLMVVMNL